MEGYNHKKIEEKWSKKWKEDKLYEVADSVSGKENFYTLVEFPYPSGNLHIGHWYAFSVPDIYARFKRMNGFNVLYPVGFDSFGLPAENAAIKRNLDPKKWTYGNIDYMKGQLESMGASFDWSREIRTSDPEYYKWTQWIFTKMFEKGLAYKAEANVNWCPSCKTTLANEQVLQKSETLNSKLEKDSKSKISKPKQEIQINVCERCDSEVEIKRQKQWMLKITDYAERLLNDLDSPDVGLDWPEEIKQSQRNWIGKSEGAEIGFEIKSNKKYKFVILHGYTANPEADFIPWLKTELENMGHSVVIPLLPHHVEEGVPENEDVEVAFSATTYDEDTIIIGHSLGAVVALKVLEKINNPVAKTLLVGGFIDPEFKDHPRPFEKTFSWNFDASKINQMSKQIEILHDKNDPAVSRDQAERLSNLLRIPIKEVEAKDEHFCSDVEPEILKLAFPSVKVFTTRPDTLFGVTYLVLAPEHDLISSLQSQISNWDEVENYIEKAKKKSELERQAEQKEKSGVELKGIKAINPANGEEISVWIADYVLEGYGTGAIMAVPAHDERDFEFAKKFGLPIRRVVEPKFIAGPGSHSEVKPDKEFVKRDAVCAIVRNPADGKYLCIKWKPVHMHGLVTGGVEAGEDLAKAAEREVREETGYKNLRLVKISDLAIHSLFYHRVKDQNRWARFQYVFFELENDEREEVSEKEAMHESIWLSREEMKDFFTVIEGKFLMDLVEGRDYLHTGDGVLYNSGSFDWMDSNEAKEKITKFVGGKKKVSFKLRDWSVGRQRYWGTPIPIVYDPEGNPHTVSEEHLPWTLPDDVDFKPTGVPPLAKSKELLKRTEEIFGKGWEPEVETLDTFIDSSWYFLRYLDPKNEKQISSKEKQEKWMPVDLYFGGSEHTTLHLLYSRFFQKVLFDLDVVTEKEPYKKRLNRGLIMGPDGQKMSKSRGNVVDPDEMVDKVGSDTVKMYLAFIGPYAETGSYPWDMGGIAGIRRFLERVYALREGISEDETVDSEVEKNIHKLIKKSTEDIEQFKFNTAISAMMSFLNALKGKNITKSQYEILIRLMAPFAPFLSEEIWENSGHKTSIHLESWPKFDSKKASEEEFTVVVQVNGKVRGSFKSSKSLEEDEAKAEAIALEGIKKWVQGKEIKKIIYVKDRVINILLG